jgi:Protein of unknown function (DUF3060)
VTRTVLSAGAACLIACPLVAMPTAHAGFGDTHVTGVGIQQTLDCNDSTLFVNGSKNIITATGTCYAVTVQGSSNVVIADNVTNDITVYGWDQTVLYKNGDPTITDVGRQLQMTNRIDRV